MPSNSETSLRVCMMRYGNTVSERFSARRTITIKHFMEIHTQKVLKKHFMEIHTEKVL